MALRGFLHTARRARIGLQHRVAAPCLAPAWVRHGTNAVTVEVPQKDEDFIGKDTRTMTNSHFRSYKAAKRLGQMAEFWEVFPDVLPKFATNINLVVSFGEARTDTVYRGNYLEAEQVAEKPTVTFPTDSVEPAVAGESMWTLMMVDPDAEQPKLHWLVGNITGNDVSTGQSIVDYTAGAPARGMHRYVSVSYTHLTLPTKRIV
eukprot:TRINITY_DN27855_c0_g1_i2.p1 TRINITY_DN27855_c0_g1~~TRINITY_DN27855_c0_g1_i2.p1  ORF type:complete len:204 (+),score=27.64 TRINITY_DN27855_c0_g1_i2:77-688(+)